MSASVSPHCAVVLFLWRAGVHDRLGELQSRQVSTVVRVIAISITARCYNYSIGNVGCCQIQFRNKYIPRWHRGRWTREWRYFYQLKPEAWEEGKSNFKVLVVWPFWTYIIRHLKKSREPCVYCIGSAFFSFLALQFSTWSSGNWQDC